jgi:hypothetical protein
MRGEEVVRKPLTVRENKSNGGVTTVTWKRSGSATELSEGLMDEGDVM